MESRISQFTRRVPQSRMAGTPPQRPMVPQRPMPQMRGQQVRAQQQRQPTSLRTAERVQQSPHPAPQRRSWGVVVLDWVIAVSVWMLFFGMPLFFVSLAYQGIAFEKQYYFYAWTLLGGAALVVRGMVGAQTIVRRTPLDIPLLVLWCVVVLSAVFSVDRYHSVFGFFGTPVVGVVSLTTAIIAYYMIVSTMTRARVVSLWGAVIASGALVTLWSFLTTMRMVHHDLLTIVPGSLMGSFSGLAIYMGILVPFFVLTPRVIGTRFPAITTVVAVALLIINGLTLSALYGYVQWYVVIGTVGVLVVFVLSRLIPSLRKSTSMAIAVFLAIMFLFLWGQPIIARVAIQAEPMLTTALSWTIAKEAVAHHPLLGSGPGTYGYNFSLFAPTALNTDGNYDMRVFTGRGMIMEGVATVGIVGVIAFLSVFFTYIGTAWTTFVRDKRDDAMIVPALGFFVASMAAAVYSVAWAIDGTIILYGVILAAACVGSIAVVATDRPQKTWSLTFTASPQHALSFAFLSIVAAVVVLFGCVTLAKMFMADVYARTALAAYTEQNHDRVMTLFQKAVYLNHNEGRYYTLVAQYGLDRATQETQKPQDRQNRDVIATAVTSAAGAARMGGDLMPNDVLAHEVKGLVLENSGGYVQGAASEALAAYQRAGALEPHNPQLDIAMGRMYLTQAQAMTGEDARQERTQIVENAKKVFLAARDKTTFSYGTDTASLFAPAHYYLATVDEALGNMDDAIAAMRMALSVSATTAGATPSDAAQQQYGNYAFNLSRLLQARNADDDRAEAEALLQHMITLRDDDINARVALGLLYEQQNQKDKAREQYTRVLEILPADDSASRETVQKMIDTVAAGESNVAAMQKNAPQEAVAPVAPVADIVSEAPTQSATTPRIAIVHDAASAEDAGKSNDILQQNGYAPRMQQSENASTGVTVLYRDDAHRDTADAVAQALRGQFPDVTTMRNDAVMTSYGDVDMVVDMGRE